VLLVLVVPIAPTRLEPDDARHFPPERRRCARHDARIP
jgi:hypothetical protein